MNGNRKTLIYFCDAERSLVRRDDESELNRKHASVFVAVTHAVCLYVCDKRLGNSNSGCTITAKIGLFWSMLRSRLLNKCRDGHSAAFTLVSCYIPEEYHRKQSQQSAAFSTTRIPPGLNHQTVQTLRLNSGLVTYVCLSLSIHLESLRSYITMGGTR